MAQETTFKPCWTPSAGGLPTSIREGLGDDADRARAPARSCAAP